MEGLKILGFNNVDLSAITYTKFGRPEININNVFIDFNISHTKDIVLCTISNSSRVGIDIEEINGINIYHFKDHFSADEWEFLEASDNPLLLFYNYWTRKEAIVKAIGYGLSIPLCTIEVTGEYFVFQNEVWYFHRLDLALSYMAHLVLNNQTEYTIKKIDFRKL